MATVQPAVVSVGDLLALSDERDLWLTRLLAAERAAYQRGFDDGRAAACVALAELEEHHAEIAWWREWWARVARIIQAETDPSARMRQVMAEIAADQKFARDARSRLAAKPGSLTPLESAVLRRVRGADPGDAAKAAGR
ncbi:MAG: hypothetical protein ACXVW7_11490 [Trebonia sp.]